jgi:hypothetical protein
MDSFGPLGRVLPANYTNQRSDESNFIKIVPGPQKYREAPGDGDIF